MEDFAKCFNKGFGESIRPASEEHNRTEYWSGTICSKDLMQYFKQEIGTDGLTLAPCKKIPQWVLELSPRLLQIVLKAAVMGDGSFLPNRNKTMRNAYYSTSKELADNIYEMAYKCGQVPTMFVRTENDRKLKLPLYTVSWSDTHIGQFPKVYKTSSNSQTKEKHNLLNMEHYNGKVWCFQVPTGLFITRRNGKITVQGNSGQFDKDFKIFTHEGVTVERVGWGQGIYDISGDITQLIKEIFIGLFAPPVIMDGTDITYANGGVAMQALKDRYMSFRNMLSHWLKYKVFAPISKIQEFYDLSSGEKQLIVPEIDWNHMSLFDAGDYINTLVTLSQGGADSKRVSLSSLYKSLGLELEDEVRKMRKESIQAAIAQKEAASLASMDLNALRALTEENEIPEPDQPQNAPEGAVPGETPGMGGDLGTSPDLGMGGGLSMPPPSSGPGAPPAPPPTEAPPGGNAPPPGPGAGGPPPPATPAI
jgi:hypothetical protein